MRVPRVSGLIRSGLLAAVAASALSTNAAFAAGGAAVATEPILAYSDSLALNGTARVTDGGERVKQRVIELTGGGFKQIGSAWATRQVDVTTSFETSFSAYLHRGTKGADGIAFLVQAAGPRALGGWGGGLGYRGIRRSVAVEFDTYQNTPDPSSNHLAVVLGGNPDRHKAFADAAIPLYGKPFQARIRYEKGTLRVFVAGAPKPVLEEKVDLAAAVGATSAWIGFTGSTGEVTSKQDVYAWTIDTPQA